MEKDFASTFSQDKVVPRFERDNQPAALDACLTDDFPLGQLRELVRFAVVPDKLVR